MDLVLLIRLLITYCFPVPEKKASFTTLTDIASHGPRFVTRGEIQPTAGPGPGFNRQSFCCFQSCSKPVLLLQDGDAEQLGN